MSDPTCARCPKPIHDTAYVCKDCGRALERALQLASRLAGDITLTVAKLTRMERPGGGQRDNDLGKAPNALFPMPLPVDLNAAHRHDAAVNALHTWARHACEERGIRVLGDGHPLAVVAVFLITQVSWLRYRPEADEAFQELGAACRTIEHVVDRPPGTVVVGRCECGTYLYAARTADTVTCAGCSEQYDVAASREGLRDELSDRLLTAGQIATMAAYLGLTERREAARLLINVWGNRGLIQAHGQVDGDRAYRFGEVLPRLLAVHGVVA